MSDPWSDATPEASPLSREQRPLLERGWRYSMVGLACAVTNYIIILAVDSVGGHYLIGVLIAFLGVTPFGYVLHSQFTFAEPLQWKSFLRFSAGVATAYPIAVLMMVILCSGLGLGVVIATPIATVALFLWNFAAAHWAIVPRFEFALPSWLLKSGQGKRQAAKSEE